MTDKGHHESMFAAYCPGHRSKVPLFPDNIRALVNRPDGVEVRWLCSCGAEGVSRFDGPDEARRGAA